MTNARFIVWWRLFDARRRALGLAPSAFGTAMFFWRRSFLPEEAAEQDRRWLSGTGVSLGSVA